MNESNDDDATWNNKGKALVAAWNEREDLRDDRNELYQAYKCFLKATEINPKNAEAWYNRALSCQELCDYKEAIECFRRAIELEPSNADLWIKLGKVLSTFHQYDKSPQHDEVLACFDRAIEIDPANVEAWLEKGSTLAWSRRLALGIKCFDKAIEIKPKPSTCFKISFMLKSVGPGDKYAQANYEEGIRYWNKGEELRRDFLMPNEEIKFKSEVNLEYAGKSDWRVLLTSQRLILFRDSGYSISDDDDDPVVSEKLSDIREIKYRGSILGETPAIIIVGKIKHELAASNRARLKHLYQDLRDYIRH